MGIYTSIESRQLWPFWREVEGIAPGGRAYAPTKLGDWTFRWLSRIGWEVCRRRGHKWSDADWRYTIGSDRCHRFCARCHHAEQRGTYTTDGRHTITETTE